MKDMMIDIETLGRESNCVITSVGACVFDVDTCKVDTDVTFHCYVQWGNQDGRVIESQTLQWWMKQANFRNEMTNEPRYPLPFVLGYLTDYIKRTEVKRVWAKGIAFDFGVLKNAYKMYSTRVPWHFRDEIDARVVYYLGKMIGLLPRERSSTKHDALADAIYQAWYVVEVLNVVQKMSKMPLPATGFMSQPTQEGQPTQDDEGDSQ